MSLVMNERIENLIYHSGLIAQGCWDKFDDYDKEALNKFAELILKQCLSYVDDSFGDVDYVKFMIKRDFGVEE